MSYSADSVLQDLELETRISFLVTFQLMAKLLMSLKNVNSILCLLACCFKLPDKLENLKTVLGHLHLYLNI